MSFDAVDVSGKTGDRQKMDAAITQFKNDQFEPAALAFFDMSQDPAMAGLSVESEYWLAKSLYKLGMYHSSLQMFSKVLARGPSTKFFKSSLDSHLLDLLWNKYWVNALSSNPLINTRDLVTGQLADIGAWDG